MSSTHPPAGGGHGTASHGAKHGKDHKHDAHDHGHHDDGAPAGVWWTSLVVSLCIMAYGLYTGRLGTSIFYEAGTRAYDLDVAGDWLSVAFGPAFLIYGFWFVFIKEKGH